MELCVFSCVCNYSLSVLHHYSAMDFVTLTAECEAPQHLQSRECSGFSTYAWVISTLEAYQKACASLLREVREASQRRRLYVIMIWSHCGGLIALLAMGFSYLPVCMPYDIQLGHVASLDNAIVANLMQAETWNAVSDFSLGTLLPPETQA